MFLADCFLQIILPIKAIRLHKRFNICVQLQLKSITLSRCACICYHRFLGIHWFDAV